MDGDTKKEVVRRHGITISIATILAWAPLAPLFWLFIKPALISAVSVAVADDIQSQVQQEVRPLTSAFRVILRKQIDRLRVEIEILRSQRARDPSNWTDEDARRLEDKQIELEDLQSAYDQLVKRR